MVRATGANDQGTKVSHDFDDRPGAREYGRVRLCRPEPAVSHQPKQRPTSQSMSLAAGEVTRWERAAHREEESHYETHFLGRADAGLDSSRLGCRRGQGAALAFARGAATVAVADISEPNLQETARLIEDLGGRALGARCDVTQAEDVKAALDRTLETFGRLDVAFNNAGSEQPITA
jgi:hypothetical protein